MASRVLLRGRAGILVLDDDEAVTVLHMAEVTGLHVVDLSLEWEPHLIRGDQ